MFSFVVIFAFLVPFVASDTPANCTFEDIAGQWEFSVFSGSTTDKTVNCTTHGAVFDLYTIKVDLLYPDIAIDTATGHTGFWTMIYNEGFEVVINNKKYFAFSQYTWYGTSVCDETLVGWVHNVVGTDWACYSGAKTSKKMQKSRYARITKFRPENRPLKTNNDVIKKINSLQKSRTAGQYPKYEQMIDEQMTLKTDRKKTGVFPPEKRLFQTDHEMIKKINSMQTSWTAGHYPLHEKMTVEQMTLRAGGKKFGFFKRPKPAQATENTKATASQLPKNFDWRNVDGRNFVSRVGDQGACGSCFAFASMGMMEARFRIANNNTHEIVLSVQDTLSCNEYAQGCNGGFAYLTAGKYAEDFGLVEESCNPYQAADTACYKTECKRYYATDYQYVGGYFGACNEELMMIALVNNGPLAIGFEVLDDFFQYKSGIYHHTNALNKFNPLEPTNHGVVIVGYGQDAQTGEKFWSVKNSWGTEWGEEGYFRISRGTDEVSVESVAMESFPIYP